MRDHGPTDHPIWMQGGLGWPDAAGGELHALGRFETPRGCSLNLANCDPPWPWCSPQWEWQGRCSTGQRKTVRVTTSKIGLFLDFWWIRRNTGKFITVKRPFKWWQPSTTTVEWHVQTKMQAPTHKFRSIVKMFCFKERIWWYERLGQADSVYSQVWDPDSSGQRSRFVNDVRSKIALLEVMVSWILPG